MLFVVTLGACGNFGGCSACGSSSPLPTGGLPGNQTIEGGAQVRVTPQGFTKLTSILPGAINSAFGGGFCVPQGQIGSLGTLGTGAKYCEGSCTGGGNGCQVDIGLNSLQTSVTNQQTLHLKLSSHVATTVKIDGKIVGIGFSCSLGVSSNNLGADVDIALGTRADNGELTITLGQVNSVSLNLDFSGCGPLSSIGNFVSDVIDSFIGQFIIQLLTPTINDLIQGFLPNPLGIASITDVGSLLAGVSPGTTALMETRIVPGGYANLVGNGMSLGIITGLNSDTDPSTRTGMRPDGVPYASEPNTCVPALPAPDFGAAPYSLPTVARSALTNPQSAFALAVANDFNGAGETGSDVPDIKMGLSEKMLDLLGHHLVTSGALCLGVGTTTIQQLNVGTIGLLVPSLLDLESGTGNDPLLLVTRPQRALDFTIGDNTMASPAITIGISHLEVDFYAFLYERYVRVFTMDLSLNVGINLEFEQTPGMPAMIKPSIVGISSQNVQVSILNSDFVKETPDHLAMVLPSVFDLVTPLLGNIAPIQVPSFAGFTLNNPAIAHVVTAQDNFLALTAQLGAGFAARQLAQKDPFAADAVRKLDDSIIRGVDRKATGIARLDSVNVPDADAIRSAFTDGKTDKLPTVTFDVGHTDQVSGQELEWSWNFNGGMWHPWATIADKLVIRDRAFAYQGKYDIGLMSRVKGDIHSQSDETHVPVTIDSVAPQAFADKATWNADGYYEVPVWDVVSGDSVQIAYGRPGADKPSSNWVLAADAKLTHEAWDKLQVGGEVALFARDEAGNVSQTLVGFHGQSGASGCACQTTGTPGAGSLILFGIVGAGLIRRRRRPFSPRVRRIAKKIGFYLSVCVLASIPACDCSNHGSCETEADCDACPDGQVAFCLDNTCVCADDIPLGHVGPYSDVVAAPSGTVWVSAYAQSHGDLVVAQATGGRIPDDAWQWIDGVPEGPVTVPGSKIRGGISDDGADVGMYTSIAAAADDTIYISYYDVDRGALKIATHLPGATMTGSGSAGSASDAPAWTTSDVELSTGAGDPGSVMNSVGMYTSISVDPQGRPGIAYLAHVSDGTTTHAEVRFAQANTTTPGQPSDWTVFKVDSADLPPDDPNNPNVYPLPEGLGLFIDSSRDPSTGAPVIAYYDRSKGDLKVSKFDTSTNAFTTAITLDGSVNMVDAGWSPSIQVNNGKVSVAYVNATTDDLRYITEGGMPEIVDDGYRIVGTTVDGLPKPTYDFVGDDAGLVMVSGSPMIVYQDATTEELLLAHKNGDQWTHESVAGATQPWPGAYGFFASGSLSGTNIVLSTWVIDQPTAENWVEVFTKPVGVL
ncbi:MAG: MYXO-CTERM sorting domain-containing protein [Kofleriaceae bacterium]